jgi:hypothetical protein
MLLESLNQRAVQLISSFCDWSGSYCSHVSNFTFGLSVYGMSGECSTQGIEKYMKNINGEYSCRMKLEDKIKYILANYAHGSWMKLAHIHN